MIRRILFALPFLLISSGANGFELLNTAQYFPNTQAGQNAKVSVDPLIPTAVTITSNANLMDIDAADPAQVEMSLRVSLSDVPAGFIYSPLSINVPFNAFETHVDLPVVMINGEPAGEKSTVEQLLADAENYQDNSLSGRLVLFQRARLVVEARLNDLDAQKRALNGNDFAIAFKYLQMVRDTFRRSFLETDAVTDRALSFLISKSTAHAAMVEDALGVGVIQRGEIKSLVDEIKSLKAIRRQEMYEEIKAQLSNQADDTACRRLETLQRMPLGSPDDVLIFRKPLERIKDSSMAAATICKARAVKTVLKSGDDAAIANVVANAQAQIGFVEKSVSQFRRIRPDQSIRRNIELKAILKGISIN